MITDNLLGCQDGYCKIKCLVVFSLLKLMKIIIEFIFSTCFPVTKCAVTRFVDSLLLFFIECKEETFYRMQPFYSIIECSRKLFKIIVQVDHKRIELCVWIFSWNVGIVKNLLLLWSQQWGWQCAEINNY